MRFPVRPEAASAGLKAGAAELVGSKGEWS